MSPRLQSDVLVPLYGMDDFDASLARLNKKAQAFGLDPIAVVETVQQRYYWQTRDTNSGGESFMVRLKAGEAPPHGQSICVVNRLSLDYPIVKLGAWSVVGQIEAAGDGNLLFAVSDDPEDRTAMSAHANCPINCEHCNTKRSRKLSYLLKSDVGEYKEVGSTCLEDFTGIDPGAALFMQKMYVFWSEYDEDSISEGLGRVTGIPVRGYLARVLFCMEEERGFVSAAMGRERMLTPTYQSAAGVDQELKRDDGLRDRFYQSYERHAEYAQKIIDWWLESSIEDSFAHNIKVLFGQEDIELKSKHLAFAAGAVAGYQRQLAKAAEENPQSVHVGSVGEKRDEPLTLRSVASWETAYGWQWRINFADEQGNRLSWKTGRPPSDLLEPQAVGRTLAARFKVKGHDEYKGTATTEVSHLKVDHWLDAEVQAACPVAVITVRPDTAAFSDLGLRRELANIVRGVGEQMDRLPVGKVEVCDINGNVVGEVSFAEPAEAMADDEVRFSLRVPGGSAAAQVAGKMADALLAGASGVEDEHGQVIGAVDFGQAVLAQERERETTPQADSALVL